jgi:hypothetical protein
MKVKIKKIIAREFLFLLLTIIVTALSYLVLNIRNNYLIGVANTQNTELKKIEEQKNKYVLSDLETILQDYVATANFPKYNSDWNLINSKFPELKKYDPNVLQEYVATANNEKYNSDWNIINSKFPEFFKDNQKYKDSLNILNQKIKELNTNTWTVNSKICSSDRLFENTIFIGLIIFLTIFLLRYLIYTTIWSIKIIKTKSE